MHARWRPTALAAVASGLTVGLMAAGMGLAGGVAGPQEAPDRDRPSAEAFEKKATARALHRVTLITGDRVTLLAGPKGTWQTSVEAGKGRGEMNFRTYHQGDRHYVIPSDVGALVAKGTLDRRLFDVAGLAADGYDDRDAKAIPLIVTYRGKAGRSAVESSGADQTRNLRSINGSAVRVAKKNAAAFLDSVAGSRAEARLAAGVEKVWLDGVRKPLLEQSVPQIGAPAAWEAGYTGKGVKVAVLDGGVEGTHPDLTGQVAESKNFSESAGGDPDGHGTHVASTVAGTGTASDGRRKGVAPNATILDGKVCEDGGWCQESAVLAGMQWAATEKDADVINLSLGGPDTPEIDPLEEAVNTLTEQTGALFVISAGNEGEWGEPVGSPGSADAALTVGAVDKSDELASFSSRGPRVGDDGLKPDLTAPGVDIVAAKSKQAWIGEPVDDVYMRLSGTSMASPHVAGAAALLAQQHPDWEAAELKAALMGSAKPHAEHTAYEQGAGRVDAAAALEQSVFATTPSLSLGRAMWPHDDDDPIVKQLTYRNTGTDPVTFDLTAEMTGTEGQPAPDDALTLSASEVTVPAGGIASVTVTANTNHDGPDGLYTGRVTANADGSRVTTPVAVHKEVESYDLTVRYVGPDGAQGGGLSILVGLDQPLFEDIYPANGTFTKRLTKGAYHLHTELTDPEWTSFYHLVQPNLVLDKDTTIDADARTAEPVTDSVPAPDAVRESLVLRERLVTANGGGAGITFFYGEAKIFTRSVGDGRPEDKFWSAVVSDWIATDAASDSKEYYTLFDYRRGSYFTGHTQTPSEDDLATVASKLRAPGGQATGAQGFYPIVPDVGGVGAMFFDTQLPTTATHHLHGPDGVQWRGGLMVYDLTGEGWWSAFYDGQATTYQPGRTYREVWNGAVVGPSAMGTSAERAGGRIETVVSPYTDSGGHVSWDNLLDSASTKLYRDGELLAESESLALFAEDVPAERGRFRLEVSAVRDPAVSGSLSTKFESAWTFSSQGTEKSENLPLWSVRYQPKVDDFNGMKRQPVTLLPIQVESELGTDAAKLGKVVVEVSGDDGKTWQKAGVERTGDGRYLATFKTPKGASVSLRATVADEAGNTAKQTIIAAYLLR